jgi:hypothetical protein
VDVGQVQDLQRPLAGRQDGQRFFAQSEEVAFDD